MELIKKCRETMSSNERVNIDQKGGYGWDLILKTR